MYNSNSVYLGQAPTPAKSSMFESLFANVQKGVEAGLNVYSKVKQIQDLVKARKKAEEQARAPMQMPVVVPPMPISPTPTPYVSPIGGGVNWAIVGLIGVGGLVLVSVLTRKGGQ